MRWGSGLVLLAVLGLTACPSTGFFVCSTDSECDESENGRCEPSGSCSFPDPACETGRRYGGLGNPLTANACVPPEDIGSTGVMSAGANGSSSGGEVGSSSSSTSSDGSESSAESSEASSSSSSTGGETTPVGSSSSSGADPVLPDLWQPCNDSSECMGFCVESVDVLDQPLGRFCSQECPEPAAECTDPGTGAEPRCTMLFVDGMFVDACLLDCGETGDAGCPDGMECLLEELPEAPPRCGFPA